MIGNCHCRYEQSFHEIRSFEKPSTFQEEQRFTNLISDIFERHGPTLVCSLMAQRVGDFTTNWKCLSILLLRDQVTIARGILELRSHLGVGFNTPMPEDVENEVFQFLDTFYSSRIGIRTLIGMWILDF